MTNLSKPSSDCLIQYSEEIDILGLDGPPAKCDQIVIKSLPPVGLTSTPLAIEFGRTGIFTFKKDLDLSEYEGKDVYLEDQLTGKIFNLKDAEEYSFHVNRRVPNRFILHIDNMLIKYALLNNLK
jgi:hypothetical protein